MVKTGISDPGVRIQILIKKLNLNLQGWTFLKPEAYNPIKRWKKRLTFCEKILVGNSVFDFPVRIATRRL